MKRFALVLALLASFTACNKPSEEDCKKAIENMRKLLKTSSHSTDLAPHIRRCRGGSTKEAVECATKATSRAELESCGFAHFDEKPVTLPGEGSGSGSGSATP